MRADRCAHSSVAMALVVDFVVFFLFHFYSLSVLFGCLLLLLVIGRVAGIKPFEFPRCKSVCFTVCACVVCMPSVYG